ncbi:MAG TPA: GH3 auxin-responsive promoter family protein, partial [Candidatus Synoicihabitans sp.]|nr:GH3 auxin-responsive promoter family protein [Candidatus Synoicihabitans sp.]
KHIPVPNEMLVHFRRAGLESLLHYTARVQRSTVFRGRHLIVGGSTAVEAIGPSAVVADVSGIAIANLPAWVEKHFFEPGREISAMTEWEPKLAAIAARTRAKDIAVVAGLPTALLALAEVALRERGNGNGATARLSTLWPTLECLVHGGLSLGPFGDELRQLAGNGVSFHEVYPSAEGFIAAQDADASAGLRLMTDTGLFFEFVPLADFQESHLDTVSAKAVPLEGAKVGVDYALLLTAPSGLCRYITGDIVRLLNLDPPRLVYCGQTRLLLSAWGERVTERELTGALTLTCQRHQWRTVNFHVAPLPAGPGGGRHEWWLELKPGTVETPKGPAIAAELDDEIQRHNALYRAKRKGGQLQEPVVRLVMPGVFEQWARQRGRWGGHGKTPRSRPDRQIADELAKLSPFSP